MNLVENVILNLILILFPMFIYFIYSCYESINKDKYKDIVLYFALFTSTYIFLKYGSSIVDNKMLLFSNIPVIVAYLKKNGILGIILSMFVVIYCYYIFNYNIMIISLKFVLYFIIYIITKNKKIKESEFIAIIAVVQGFFLSFEYFFVEHIDIYGIVKIFLLTLLFYVITFFVLYLFSFINKITSLFVEIKELEREKEIKNSLFKLTHEIKNPIAVCKGYLDMIDINDIKKTNRYIEIIKQEINRSLNIMNDFLEFSKIKVNKDIVDVNVLLDDIYDSFKIINKSNNIKIIYNENNDDIYINGDYDRLKQVLLNIIKNSMEAIEGSGNIKIYTEINNCKCVIIIEDDGIGMDNETLSNIKKLFYTTKKSGSGIGVSLSNEIIKAHNGELNYYSSLGKGTRVEIILPKEM